MLWSWIILCLITTQWFPAGRPSALKRHPLILHLVRVAQKIPRDRLIELRKKRTPHQKTNKQKKLKNPDSHDLATSSKTTDTAQTTQRETMTMLRTGCQWCSFISSGWDSWRRWPLQVSAGGASASLCGDTARQTTMACRSVHIERKRTEKESLERRNTRGRENDRRSKREISGTPVACNFVANFYLFVFIHLEGGRGSRREKFVADTQLRSPYFCYYNLFLKPRRPSSSRLLVFLPPAIATALRALYL